MKSRHVPTDKYGSCDNGIWGFLEIRKKTLWEKNSLGQVGHNASGIYFFILKGIFTLCFLFNKEALYLYFNTPNKSVF